MKKNELFESLPAHVQRSVSNALKGFREVHVWFENGQYHTSTGACVRSEYAKDYKAIGTISANDIYTEAEQNLNQVEIFRSYPRDYKGKRDMELLAALADDAPLEYDAKGNIQPKATDTGTHIAVDFFGGKARSLDRFREQLLGWMDDYDIRGDADDLQALSASLAALKEVVDNIPLY